MYSDGILAQAVRPRSEVGWSVLSLQPVTTVSEAYEAIYAPVSFAQGERRSFGLAGPNVHLDQIPAGNSAAERAQTSAIWTAQPASRSASVRRADNTLSFQWTSRSSSAEVKTDFNIYVFDRTVTDGSGLVGIPGFLHDR